MDVARFKNEIIAVLIVVVFAFVINGIKANFDAQIAELDRRSQEVKTNQKQLQLFNEMDNKYRLITRKFPFADRQLLTNLVEQTAREHNLKIDNLRPITKDMKFYEEVKVEMGLTYPEYERLVTFLGAIGRSNIGVSRIYIGPNKKCKLTLRGAIVKEQ